jgi:hypothetical protein
MNAFSIIRTNVGLTSNIKVTVTENSSIYLDSIDSAPELSNSRFKKFKVNKDIYWDQLLSDFFKGVSTDISFLVKDDMPSDIMLDNFENQYDDLYFAGCQNISQNKEYIEEFEAFAPIYLEKGEIPKSFVIFRVDGPGKLNLNKDNFRTEILDKFKLIKLFDLSTSSNIGYWLDKNLTQNKWFPLSPLYIDFRNIEFSYWNGIDLINSGYVSSPIFMENILEFEMNYFDFHKLIYDGYKNNGVVFPNIFNLSFLFNDTPATKNSLKKWSLNRYYGFYLEDMVESDKISFFDPLQIRDDVSIDTNNFIISASFSSPFVEDWRFKQNTPIQILGEFYPVVKIDTDGEYKYKIISDKSFFGLTFSSINNKIFEIDDLNKLISDSNYQISGFDDADVLLIDIDGEYFRIIKNNGEVSILCDGGFRFFTDRFEYFINDPDPNFVKKFNYISDVTGLPKNFNIYKLKFLDIKDFDTQIVETEYARYEYEYKNKLNITDETKLYATNLIDNSNPKPLDEFNISGEFRNIPVSSEYIATGELFKIDNNDLTDIWKKNPKFVKWAISRSNSSYDYPYLLNNNFLSEDFNRTVNPFNSIPLREDRNLDYFYSIMTGTNSYSFNSLHINDEDTNFGFDLTQYLNSDSDYFSQFFGKTSSFSDGEFIVKNRKWSKFNKGDFTLPNYTVFRGIKFTISDVENIEVSENSINNVNLENSNKYDGWKFSILIDELQVEEITTTTTTTTSTTTQICSCERIEYLVENIDSDNTGYYTYEDCGDVIYKSVEITPLDSITICACENTVIADLGYESIINITPGASC